MWTPDRIGLGRARLEAIRDIIKVGVPDLNTALHNEATLSNATDGNDLLGAYFGGDLDPQKCVIIGVPLTVWNQQEGFLRIGVMSGDPMRGGSDGRFALEEIGQGPTNMTWTTSVIAVFHPSAVRTTDPTRNVTLEVLLSSLVSDWLRAGVLNTFENTVIYLPSQEITDTPSGYDGTTGDPLGYDRLVEAYVRSVTIGPFALASGKDILMAYSIHMQHQGIVSA